MLWFLEFFVGHAVSYAQMTLLLKLYKLHISLNLEKTHIWLTVDGNNAKLDKWYRINTLIF